MNDASTYYHLHNHSFLLIFLVFIISAITLVQENNGEINLKFWGKRISNLEFYTYPNYYKSEDI